MKSIEKFGINSFDKRKMKEYLPHPIYLKWKEAVRNQEDLDRESADAIAHAMKAWAIENGATHYAHWFSPLNGLTAKKLESFLDRSENEPIYRFSGKELVKGEPDASSFPSGGMRTTFEARGYTYWDLTANSFIMENILYIPTMFMSYTGQKLDKRAPLINSTKALSEAGIRVVNLLKKDEYAYRLRVKVGLEQEFFLVDKKLYDKRRDLVNTGKTLFGAPSIKGQELHDHYFGAIPYRVQKFYESLNKKLFDLGIVAKAEHNEVAPLQFEVAILFENVNVAIDQNLILMSILQETALEYDMVCLMHEKPFKGVNGSGKHNNYSIMTNYGLNCFDPGNDPYTNDIFLLFVAALIESTDKYAPLLRVTSSSAQNDDRLGGDEAPPAIVTMFLGEDLEYIFECIARGEKPDKIMDNSFRGFNLKEVPRDTSDRNRTVTMAFTGNKFEFRMLGSSKNASDVNTVLNSAMSVSLNKIADRLLDAKDLREETLKIVAEIVNEHRRVIFSGDNYSKEWQEEAARRNLPNYKTYYEALMGVLELDLDEIFIKNNVFKKEELKASLDVCIEDVQKHHELQLRCALAMVSKDLLPSINRQIKDYENSNEFSKRVANILNDSLSEMSLLYFNLLDRKKELDDMDEMDEKKRIEVLQFEILPKLKELRRVYDSVEDLLEPKNLCIPTYEDMFNSLE